MNLRAALLALSLTLAAGAQQTDPTVDRHFPAAMQTVQLPSHGALLNGFVYIAAGEGPHPVAVMLHGFPGNERNLDLAQALRRAGWDVLFFDYRGSWGSPGSFSFTHAMEDTAAAVAFLRQPAQAARLRLNAAKLILVGHSMGGMIAARLAADDPAIRGLVLISAANMAGQVLPAVEAGDSEAAVVPLGMGLAAEGLAPLAGCTPESLARDLLAHARQWDIPSLAPQLTTRPLLAITSDDSLAPSTDELVARIKKLGGTQVTAVHLATDHAYSDQRLALERAVLAATTPFLH